MVSALTRKSVRDLSRRRARTVFTVLTVAFGVAGLGMLAISDLADQGVEEHIRETRMYNVRINMNDVPLNDTNLRELGQLPNVKAVDARAAHWTRMYIGERRAPAYILGIEDFGSQGLDLVSRVSGDLPGAMEVLTEESNSINGVFDGGAGDTFPVIDFGGQQVDLRVSGVGKCLVFSPYTYEGLAIFYADIGTVRALGNLTGYNTLSFQVEDQSGPAIERTIEDIRDYLTDATPVVAFAELPRVRSGNDWESKEVFNNIVSSVSVLTVIILLASAFLISNTMNTIISEQRREIGQLKAIGATSRQVFRSFLTTSLLIGVMGAAIGAVLGIFVSNFVLVNLVRQFGLSFGFMVHGPIVLLSFLIGVGIVLLASLPALVRSSRVVVREALESSGISATYGEGALDRLMMRGGRLPRSVQMGIRNIGRKKGRSLSTLLQVALAVGLFMGLISLSIAVTISTEGAWSARNFDVRVLGTVPEEDLDDLLAIENVGSVEPFITTQASINGRVVEIWGFTSYSTAWDHEATVVDGRWFSEEDHRTNATVMVVGPALAEIEDLDVGETVPVMTATGEVDFKVIGIQDSLMDNGQAVFAPFTSLQHVLRDDRNSGAFLHTTTGDHAAIDRVATQTEDMLVAKGLYIGIDIKYVEVEQNIASNAGIVAIFMIVSGLIVVISMIGLMSTLTMNILDRTKEIGMLRCIGARARDIRRVFSTEGLTISLAGWAIGLPLGAVLGFVIQRSIEEAMKIEVPSYYAWGYIPWAFVVTVLGTMLVIQPPIWRATRFKPGDALRYQ